MECCCVLQGECDMSYGEDFRFSVLCDELVVGEVYVRVYNEQPTFVLEVSGHYGEREYLLAYYICLYIYIPITHTHTCTHHRMPRALPVIF